MSSATPTVSATPTATFGGIPTGTPVCNGGMAIFGGSGSYDSTAMNSTYVWIICSAIPACPPSPGPEIAQFRLDLSSLDACGGLELHSIQEGTTTPYSTTDPACFGGPNTPVVKWPMPPSDGTCESLTLVLAGELATGTVDAGTITGMNCPLVEVSGPVCLP